MLSKTLLIICSLFLVFSLNPETTKAQSDAMRANLDNALRSGSGVVMTRPLSKLGVVGTPHFNDYWTPTKLTFNNGQSFEDVPAKYNAFIDRVEVIHEGDTLELSDVLIREFVLMKPDGDVAKFRNRIGRLQGEFDRNSYLQVLHDGEVGVYKRHRKILREASTSGSSYGVSNRHDRFIEDEQLYFKNENDEFSTVRLRQRNVLRLFGDHRDEIREFASYRNLDFRSESDFLEMVKHYEELVANSN